MQFVVFDVRADLAQFKKPFTTMSPQTFGFPTGTALIGIISAIVGLDKDEYWRFFAKDEYSLAVGVKKPIKKVVIPFNTLKTTSMTHFFRFKEHKRTTMEFIKDGEFRIWFSWKDTDRFAMLVDKLKNHESHYTVSLGLAWNLADFRYIDMVSAESISNTEKWYNINSVIRKDLIEEVEFEERKIFVNRIPVRMRPDNSRVVEQYDEYLFENDGLPIHARVKTLMQAGDDYIVPI